ncbi:hypothetical protein GQR58_029159 [Nymphon striatum]|nr:hypothetical protein GQR58_029159 [Nymphon striatum]
MRFSDIRSERHRASLGRARVRHRSTPTQRTTRPRIGQMQDFLTSKDLYHQGGNQTGVGAVVVAEVVVTGVFTSKGCARLGHGAFDEGVSNSGAHCGAATLGNYLGNRLGADQVVQNRGTRRSTDAATMAVVHQVLGLNWIGWVIWECAVEFRIQMIDLERQVCESGWRHEPTHAVGGVDDNLERAQRGDVDEAVQVLYEVVKNVGARERSGRC